MDVIPVRDWILFERIEEKQLIQLPDKSDPLQAGVNPYYVVRIGPDVKAVKVGDQVITFMPLGKAAMNGEQLYFGREEHVALIIRHPKKGK